MSMPNPDGFSPEALREELRKAQQALEELEEERLLTLGQTGVHIGAQELHRLTSSFARDEARLRARIQELAALLEGHR
ncbi:MAG: hypothetical protein QHH80_05285 [Anaerolineae bacterium]|nr:hypothetical protein [Anaerolineae bacterium]